jgi:soluble lytic murein transglycosylase-like protein
MKRIAALCFFVFLLVPAGYSQGGENTDIYEQFITEACALWRNVPPSLALAVAKQESGLHPWAVNVAGRGYIFGTPEEASRLIDRAWGQGDSFDTGLMQINSYWLRRYGLNPHMLLEPKKNAVMGVWILSREIERFGLTWRAVASYHTPVAKNPERGKYYALAVIRKIKK